MRPKAEMKLKPAFHRFVPDELQHFQIFVALRIGKGNRTHIVAGNCQEERIREMKIGIGNIRREIVADAKGEAEAIETLSCKFSEICLPEGTIVEPYFVFDVAVEWASDASDFVGRFLENAFDAT